MPRNALVFITAIAAIAIAVWTVDFYFGGGGIGAAARPGGGPAMLVGAPAASYPVRTLDGETASIESYRGKVLLVNLWASWCAPCRSETPALERLYAQERSRGLVVLGIDQGESSDVARRFASEMKLTYPIAVDEGQRYGRAYAAIGLPTTLVVDRTGHIAKGVDGELSLAQMHDAVDPLLAR